MKNITIGPDFATQGRAATEEQLKLMQGSITQSAQGGGFGLTADGDGTKAAKADLGSTIGIHGDSNITTAVSEDGKSIDIKLKNQVNLGDNGSLSAGGVTINNSGINAGGNNIINVHSGIVNKDDSDNTNAANIGDVKKLAGDAAKGAVDSLGTRDLPETTKKPSPEVWANPWNCPVELILRNSRTQHRCGEERCWRRPGYQAVQ